MVERSRFPEKTWRTMTFSAALFFILVGAAAPIFSAERESILSSDGSFLKVQTEQRSQVDSDGHDQQWWRERVQMWQNKKAEANNKLTQAQEELANNQLSTFQAIQKRIELNEEIQQYQNDLREAEEMLSVTLPDEARKAGAPPGWLR